jgi:hypothetical protein
VSGVIAASPPPVEMVPPTTQNAVLGHETESTALIALGSVEAADVQLDPAFVVSTTTGEGVGDPPIPTTMHIVVLGHEMPANDVVPATPVGPNQTPASRETNVPLPLAFPTARHTVGVGHEMPVVVNPSCCIFQADEFTLANLVSRSEGLPLFADCSDVPVDRPWSEAAELAAGGTDEIGLMTAVITIAKAKSKTGKVILGGRPVLWPSEPTSFTGRPPLSKSAPPMSWCPLQVWIQRIRRRRSS